MVDKFTKKSVLIAMHNTEIMQMLCGVCTLLCFHRIDSADNYEEAVGFLAEHNHDLIITDVAFQPHGVKYFVENIRKNKCECPNPDVPILLNCGHEDAIKADDFREFGVSELILSPFSADDIHNRFLHIFKNTPKHKKPNTPSLKIDIEPPEGATSAEQEDALVKSLLSHYLQHQETVLKKLQFAQDATLQSIQEIRDVGCDLQERDNTTLHDFSKLEKMWQDIIALFVEGGLSEEDIFKVENLITDIPHDIKKHYKKLSQQDKSFLTLIEAMNHDAYRKALDIAITVQDKPNPITGLTRSDYQQEESAEPTISEASFYFASKKSGS